MKTKKKTHMETVQTRDGAARARTIIRPFESTDSEYADVVAIENANYPDLLSGVNEFRFYDDTNPDHLLHERLVAERDDRLIGFITYGQPWWSLQEGKYFFWLGVDPDWHDTAVPKELYAAMMAALRPLGPRLMTSEVREDQAYVVALLERQGYTAVQRNPMSALDVDAFDFGRYAALRQAVSEAGIDICDLNELAADDPDWAPKVWELEWQILQDVPSPDPLTQAPFDEWRTRTFDAPNFTAGGYLVARDGDAYVGMSSLWTVEADPTKLHTGLTGVLPAYRRRGIATALKVAGIAFAQTYGAQTVLTDNEENNPMLDLNKQLGFAEIPAFVMYAKELQEETNAREREQLLEH